MKRFTHSLLATSLLFTASAISAQESEISNERTLTRTIVGDYESTYAYDQSNRLTSVESLASNVTFDYSPVSFDNENYDITMRISDPSGDIVCFLTVGDNGFISKSIEIEEIMGEQAPYKTLTFEYDTEGHLTRINEIGFTDFSSTMFEYSDGNLTSANTTGTSSSSKSISYTSATKNAKTPNASGVMDFTIFGIDDIETGYLYNAGLLGTATADLPVRSEMTTDGTFTADTYVWNINNQGLPTSRTTISDNGSASSTEYAWADTSALADMMTVKTTSAEMWYNINGMRHDHMTRGINIGSTPSGTVVKTLQK